MTVIVELIHSQEHQELLQRFYQDLYVAEFPDPDERESLENMAQYLLLKSQGWYRKNNYHILVATEAGTIIAGVIADFLAEANAGVIEFLVVSPGFRHHGVGSTLLSATENLLMDDARKQLDRELDCIAGEINDPFVASQVEDNLDPARRTLIWHQWGYRGLDFPYVQPALSDRQQPVFNLLLIARILRRDWQGARPAIPSETIKRIVHEYLRWAMRLETPGDCPEYRAMAAFLDTRQLIDGLPLDRYLGYASDKPMDICEVTDIEGSDFADLMAVYKRAFQSGPLTVASREFSRLLSTERSPQPDFRYHLWAIRREKGASIEGLASFFSFPAAGFGGYIAFTDSLLGTGRLGCLVKRMELQMLQDDVPGTPEGCYIETDLIGESSPFTKLGFREVAVDYEQPRLSDGQPPAATHLLYKRFGRSYTAPEVAVSDFLAAIRQVFHVVYAIEKPEADNSFQKMQTQVLTHAGGRLAFR